jgi:chaperonin GroEL
MIKEVLFGSDSRAKLLSGVQKITKAVAVTMGAAGRCVLIGEATYGNDGLVNLPTKVTKDGVTVARHFSLSDGVENRGAMLIIEAATKTMQEAGDSTTATCVLAESLITNGMKLIDEGANSQQLKKGMDKALEYIVDELKKMSTPVKGDIERIRQIATVSANNDKVIGDLIADAYSKIGDAGIIDIEASNGVATEIKISDGFKIDRGWISPLFVNNAAKEICEYDNPLILLYDKKVTHHTQIEKAIGISIQENKPLLIICEDAEEEGLAYLAINTYQKRFRACAIKSPEFGNLRREWMEDIALTTGGDYVSDLHGLDIKEVELSNFGQAEKVIISNTETVIKGGKKNQEKFDEFIADLQMNLVQAKTEDEKYPIEKRIARLKSSVATIQVGAATETELKEKLDRVDDSVRATRAAISEGFLAGGGTAFLRIGVYKDGSSLNDFDKGERLLHLALQTPLLQICENAGVDGIDIFKQVKKSTGNIGYNALTGEIVDMVEAGIIDSTKALRCALVNAVSVAGMVLTSECAIITVS